jgi:hypothetical protein
MLFLHTLALPEPFSKNFLVQGLGVIEVIIKAVVEAADLCCVACVYVGMDICFEPANVFPPYKYSVSGKHLFLSAFLLCCCYGLCESLG